jgi:ABC-type branched-subunit amino acid transport system ATPase component
VTIKGRTNPGSQQIPPDAIYRETIMLSVKGLKANVGENEILKGLDIEVGPGEIHAIMGPNGSGKSKKTNQSAITMLNKKMRKT